MSAVPFAQAGIIFSESEIEHPVTAIFDLPVRAERPGAAVWPHLAGKR